MTFRHLSLSKKLFGAFGAILVITTALGMFSINRLKAVNADTTDLTSLWVPSIIGLGDVRAHLAELRIAVLQHLLTTDKTQVGKWEDIIKTNKATIDKDLEHQATLVDGDDEREQLQNFKDDLGRYLRLAEVTVTLSRENKMVEATANARGPATEAYEKAGAGLKALVLHNSKGAVRSGEHSANTHASTT